MAARLNWTAASKTGATVTGYTVRKNGVVLAALGNVLTYRDNSPSNAVPYTVTATFSDSTTTVSEARAYAAPPDLTGMPEFGVSPGYTILDYTSAQQDFELDKTVDVSNGQPCFIRLDSTASNQTQMDALMAKIATRPSLVPLIILYGSATPGTSLGTFAGDQATKWGAACSYYEIVNEPDMHLWDPEPYADFLKAASQQIKAARPTAKVIAGALFHGQETTGTIVNSRTPDKFATALAQRAAGHFDLFSMHLYNDPYTRASWNIWDRTFPTINGQATWYSQTRSGGNWTGDVTVRSILNANGLSHIPIISTENGGTVRDNTEAEIATFVSRTFDVVDSGLLGSQLVYCMRNLSFPDQAQFGMLRPDGTERPAYTTFKNRSGGGVAAGPTLTALRGTPVYSTTTPKFGTHSLLGDGTACLTASAGAVDAFATAGVGTIEFWLRTTNSTVLRIALGHSGPGDWWIGLDGGRIAGTAVTAASNPVISDGVWHHVAYVFNGGNCTVYIDGVSTQVVSSATFNVSGGDLTVGGWGNNGAQLRLGRQHRRGALLHRPAIHGELHPALRGVHVRRQHHGALPPRRQRRGELMPGSLTALRGTATYSSSTPKFGTHAFTGDGTVALTTPGAGIDDFVVSGSGTIECWVRTTHSASLRIILGHSGPGDWWFGLDGGRLTGTGWNTASSPVISDGAWHHIAIDFNAGTKTSYIDGVQIQTGITNAYVIGGQFCVSGWGANGSSWDWIGDIDEVRVSSTRRYTAAFTPPSAPFSGDASTTALYHLDGNGAPDTGDTTAPTVPGNLRTTAVGATTVDLAWDASTDVVGVVRYDVTISGPV